MEKINKDGFKAVDFMRKMRGELSNLYKIDKKRYFEELQKAMADFKASKAKATGSLMPDGSH